MKSELEEGEKSKESPDKTNGVQATRDGGKFVGTHPASPNDFKELDEKTYQNFLQRHKLCSVLSEIPSSSLVNCQHFPSEIRSATTELFEQSWKTSSLVYAIAADVQRGVAKAIKEGRIEEASDLEVNSRHLLLAASNSLAKMLSKCRAIANQRSNSYPSNIYFSTPDDARNITQFIPEAKTDPSHSQSTCDTQEAAYHVQTEPYEVEDEEEEDIHSLNDRKRSNKNPTYNECYINMDAKTLKQSTKNTKVESFVYKSSDVEALEKIGEGNFSTNWRARIIGNPERPELAVALKIPKDGVSSDELKKEMMGLLAVAGQINIMNFLGVMVDKNGSQSFLTEYCSRGSLDTLHGSVDLRDEKYFWKIATGLLLAVVHLHELKLIHRDIACRNILVTENWEVRLADFGLTVRAPTGQVHIKPNEALPWPWMAPHTLKEKAFTFRSDIYSVGVTLWEVLTKGKVPHADQDGVLDYGIVDQIIEGKRKLHVPTEYEPTKMGRLVKECFKSDKSAYLLVAHLVPGGLQALIESGSPDAKSRAEDWIPQLMIDGRDFSIVIEVDGLKFAATWKPNQWPESIMLNTFETKETFLIVDPRKAMALTPAKKVPGCVLSIPLNPNDASQKWHYDAETKSIVNVSTGQKLDLQIMKGNQKNEQVKIIATSNGSSSDEKLSQWIYESSTGTIRNRKTGSGCLVGISKYDVTIGDSPQKWVILKHCDEVYDIELPAGFNSHNVTVVPYDPKDEDQHWRWKRESGGSIVHKKSGKHLDVFQGERRSPLCVWRAHGAENQQFEYHTKMKKLRNYFLEADNDHSVVVLVDQKQISGERLYEMHTYETEMKSDGKYPNWVTPSNFELIPISSEGTCS